MKNTWFLTKMVEMHAYVVIHNHFQIHLGTYRQPKLGVERSIRVA